MAYHRFPGRPDTDHDIGQGEEYELRDQSEAPTYDLSEPRDAAIVGWRIECFEDLGFDNFQCLVLATRRDVDREQVARMVKQGATHDQVMETLV